MEHLEILPFQTLSQVLLSLETEVWFTDAETCYSHENDITHTPRPPTAVPGAQPAPNQATRTTLPVQTTASDPQEMKGAQSKHSPDPKPGMEESIDPAPILMATADSTPNRVKSDQTAPILVDPPRPASNTFSGFEDRPNSMAQQDPVKNEASSVLKSAAGGSDVAPDAVAIPHDADTKPDIVAHSEAVLAAPPSTPLVVMATPTPSMAGIVSPNAHAIMATPDSIIAAGDTIVKAPNEGVLTASSTYTPGSQPEFNDVVSIHPQGIVVSGNRHTLPAQGVSTPVHIDGDPIVKASDGNRIVIGSSTFHDGDETYVSSVALNVGSDKVIVGGVTHRLPPPPSPTPLLIGGHSILQVTSGNGVVIASSTYVPGRKAKISGVKLYVGSDHIVVADTTRSFPSPASPTPVLIGGHKLLQAPKGGVIVIASKIYAADTEAEVSGVHFSVGSDKVVVAGSTHPLPSHASPTPRPVLIGGETIAIAPSHGGVMIVSKTYTPGATAKISDTVFSVGSDKVVVGGTTHHLPSTQIPVVPTPSKVLIGGHSVTIAPSHGGVIVAGQTYTPGARVQVSGTILSVGSDKAVIGSSSYDLPSESGTTAEDGSDISTSQSDNVSSIRSDTAPPIMSRAGRTTSETTESSSSDLAPTSKISSGSSKILLVSRTNGMLWTIFALFWYHF